MLTVTVKETHIQEGKPCEPKKCPVALALREVVKDCDISVGSVWTFFTPIGKNYALSFMNPEILSRFVGLVDANGGPEETVLELEWDIPNEFLRFPDEHSTT